MESRYESLVELFKNEEEAKKLLVMTAGEAAAYLQDTHNLVFSADELREVGEGMKKALDEDTGDELSENALELVAGGKSGAYNAGYYIGKTLKFIATGLKIVSFFMG